MEPANDERLWQIARKRAGFRRSLYSYIVLNAFLWCVWWFTTGRGGYTHRYPWPIWVMLGWGVALGFQYFDAYNGSKQDLTEQEYQKLKREQER
jgi:hypothetical protein